jgi:CRP-like cAMP-binding protein
MKTSPDRTAFLKKVPLFAALSVPDLRLLQGIGTLQRCAADAPIFGEDAAGDRLYVVLSGRVKIFTTAGSRTKILAYLEPGEFFGEMSLLDREPRSASSTALKASELLVIRKKDFRDLLIRYPHIAFEVMRTLSQRLRQADREIEALTFGNVLGRIAGVLLDLAARYGETTPAGCRIAMPLSHREIAEIAGTGREMVTRMLIRLKRLGCIAYSKSTITILDVDKMKRFM